MTIIFALITGIAVAQSPDTAVYHAFLHDLKSHPGLEYDVLYQHVQSGDPDTLEYKAHVKLMRIQEDTVFGGFIHVNLDTMWFGYNLQNIIVANKRRSEITLVDGRKHPNVIIRNSFVNDLVVGRFLKYADFLTKLMKDKAFKVVLSDTIIQNQECLAANITLPAQDSVKHSLLISFNKENHFYCRNIHTSVSSTGSEYNAWTFSNARYNNNKLIPELHASQLLKYKTVHDSLASKLKAPVIDLYLVEGQLLNQQKKVVLAADTTSRYIFIDGWHSGCSACHKTIPVVNQLYEKFKGRGVTFYGVNEFDTAPDQKSEIAAFVKAHPMKYPTIMIEDDAMQKVNIEGYPYMLILDKNKNIIHRERGYKDGMYEKLEAVLENLLSRN